MRLRIWVVLAGVFVHQLASADTKKTVPENFYDLPKVVAVQNRQYYLNGDLSFQLGALPSDAFNKGYSAGVSYTHYFSDYLGWEIVNAAAVVNSETNVKKDIQKFGLDVKNNQFDGILDFITYYAITSIVYTPLYNKSLLFNRDVVYGETSFVFGLGMANFDSAGARFLVSGGLYVRFFTAPNRSWKFDFRNNVYIDEDVGAVNAFSIGVAYSIQMGDPPPDRTFENIKEEDDEEEEG